jgi:hypothetical protein
MGWKVVGGDKVGQSDDAGLTWSIHSTAPFNNTFALGYNGTTWMIGSTNNGSNSSLAVWNGSSWILITPCPNSYADIFVIRQLIFKSTGGVGEWMSLGSANVSAWIGDTFNNWTQTLPDGSYNHAAWNGTHWMIVGGGGIWTSTDGAVWASSGIIGMTIGLAVMWDGSKWIVYGRTNNDPITYAVWTSPSVLNWTLRQDFGVDGNSNAVIGNIASKNAPQLIPPLI